MYVCMSEWVRVHIIVPLCLVIKNPIFSNKITPHMCNSFLLCRHFYSRGLPSTTLEHCLFLPLPNMISWKQSRPIMTFPFAMHPHPPTIKWRLLLLHTYGATQSKYFAFSYGKYTTVAKKEKKYFMPVYTFWRQLTFTLSCREEKGMGRKGIHIGFKFIAPQ